MASRRPRPKIYTTWLSKLVVGDYSCEWAAWFKSHHVYRKRPSNFDSISYSIRHTALLNRARELLESHGKTITTESQNWFEVKGKTAALIGKPDLIAIGDKCVICDAKTGQERPSDAAQVLIYMFAMPLAYPKYKGINFEGLLLYEDHDMVIPQEALTPEFTQTLLELIGRISSDNEARKVPSHAECKYCDIDGGDCADRIEEDEKQGSAETDLF